MKSWKSLWDKNKFEVTLRVGLMVFCGFSLSIAIIPNVVPPSQSLICGLVTSILCLLLPTLMFTLAAVIPSVLISGVFMAGASTMLLAAGSVSDGLFVGIYAIYSLVITTLFFGKQYGSTSMVANTYVCVVGLLSLSYLPLVQPPNGDLGTVSDMWTEKGTQNELAIWRNFMIGQCWVCACIVVGIIVPPWRTSRKLISRFMFPSIYEQVNGVLSGENVDVRALIKSKSNLKGGNVVMTTLFEPRLCHLGVDLVTPLKEIAVATDELIFRSFLVLKWKEGWADAPNELESVVLQDTITLLEDCGEALSLNERADYETLRDFVDDQVYDKMSKVGSDDPADRTTESEKIELSNSNYIYQQALKVRKSTLVYFRLFNSAFVTKKSKVNLASVLKKGLLYIVNPFVPTTRLLQSPEIILEPKKWNFKDIMWSFELASGYVALMCMGVFWDAYANFRIDVTNDKVGAVYSGWQLLAYAYSYQPTLEGTTKKGLSRILGTLFGGFSAWLGIIICSWSYDDSAPINPYGLIAWMTITTMIAAYFCSLAPGVGARMGHDKDHGFAGLYYTLTQSIIVLEIWLGDGDKNGLTLNRIVATTTGVLMAMVLSFLPPHVNGRDPEHARAYLEAMNDAFTLLLRTFADEKEESKFSDDDFKKSFLSTAISKHSYANFVLNDASMLQFLPFMRINKKLGPLMENMSVTEAMIEHLAAGFSTIISENYHVTEARGGIGIFLQEYLAPGGMLAEDSMGNPDLLVGWATEIASQFEQHSLALSEMEAEFHEQCCAW